MNAKPPEMVSLREATRRWASELTAAAGGVVRLLGISGPPGAGKTYVATALSDAVPLLTGGRATVALLPLDGFHLADSVLTGLGRRQRKGAPDTFDLGGFVSALARVRSGAEAVVYVPRFHREMEAAIAGEIAVPAGVAGVVVEGNWLLHDEDGWEAVRPLLDTTWYLEVPEPVCFARLLERQRCTYGSEQAARRWVDEVDTVNRRLIEAGRHRADLLVDPS